MRKILIAVLALLLVPLMARADGWQTSSPEAQGMSSRELADLVTFGVSNGMDSMLVVRHGTIVAEAYYAPFVPGLRHRINSATKSVIGSLVAIAHAEGEAFMAGISGQGYRPKNFLYWEAQGSLTYRSAWLGAIEGDADWIQLTTWNDFGESTQVSPYTDRTGSAGTSRRR